MLSSSRQKWEISFPLDFVFSGFSFRQNNIFIAAWKSLWTILPSPRTNFLLRISENSGLKSLTVWSNCVQPLYSVILRNFDNSFQFLDLFSKIVMNIEGAPWETDLPNLFLERHFPFFVNIVLEDLLVNCFQALCSTMILFAWVKISLASLKWLIFLLTEIFLDKSASSCLVFK